MKYVLLASYFLLHVVFGQQTELDMPPLYDGVAEDFEHPCPNLDKVCITQYYADNSGCTPVSPDARVDSVSRQSQVIYLTYCNMTIYYKDTVISGLDQYSISNFYVNRATNTHVITVCLDAVTNAVEDCRFAYHVPNKQSIVKGDNLNATYAVCLTAETPLNDDGSFNTALSRVNAFVSDVNPTFYIGEDIMNGSSEQVAASMECLLSDLPTGLQYTFTSEARPYFYAWARSQICDFSQSLTYIDYFRY